MINSRLSGHVDSADGCLVMAIGWPGKAWVDHKYIPVLVT